MYVEIMEEDESSDREVLAYKCNILGALFFGMQAVN
jgi:hypothetical protein